MRTQLAGARVPNCPRALHKLRARACLRALNVLVIIMVVRVDKRDVQVMLMVMAVALNKQCYGHDRGHVLDHCHDNEHDQYEYDDDDDYDDV